MVDAKTFYWKKHHHGTGGGEGGGLESGSGIRINFERGHMACNLHFDDHCACLSSGVGRRAPGFPLPGVFIRASLLGSAAGAAFYVKVKKTRGPA